MTEDKMVGWHHNSMDMNLDKLQEMVRNRNAWHAPSNEYSGLISFRMEWLDLLAVQGIVRSLFQHHSSKASILWGIQSQPAQSSPLGLGF